MSISSLTNSNQTGSSEKNTHCQLCKCRYKCNCRYNTRIISALYLIFSTNGRWQSKQARVPFAKDAFGCFSLNCSWLHRTAHWPLALAQQSHSSANDTVEKMCKSESWCKNWVQRQFPASACSVTAALLRHRRTTHRRNHRRCSTQPLPQQIHKYTNTQIHKYKI